MAALGLWAVALRLWDLPHAGFPLFVIPVAVAIFPLRRRWPDPALLVLTVLAGAAPVVGPVAAAAAYTVAIGTVRPRHRVRLLGGASLLITASATSTGPSLGAGSAAYGLELGLVLAVTAVVVPGLVGTVYGSRPGCCGRCANAATRPSAPAGSPTARPAPTNGPGSPRRCTTWWVTGSASSPCTPAVWNSPSARPPPELREEAVLVRHTARDAMRELRQALGVPGPLGRGTGPDAFTDATGTRPDVEALVAESRDGGVAVRLEWSGPDLDSARRRYGARCTGWCGRP